jgi:hypothetical protein
VLDVRLRARREGPAAVVLDARAAAVLDARIAAVLVLDATAAAVLDAPGVWISLGMALATAYVIARGFRRKGWERWAQIVAGLWLGYATFTLVVAAETRDMFDPPASGGWVLLFALSAAAPAVGWILWPKRRA